VLSSYALRSLARALFARPALRGGALDRHLREAIVLRVSAVNRCHVCSSIHDDRAGRLGLTRDEVSAARRAESEDERTRAALRYAELRTFDLERDFPEEVRRFESLFTAAEQKEARAVIDLFTFNNRFNNTWEAWLPGARQRRKKMGLANADRARDHRLR
jgi:AhpD family alkylhydroperoxidase